MAFNRIHIVLSVGLSFGFAVCSYAQDTQLTTALAIKPNQKEIEFDQPNSDELSKCQVERTADTLKIPGWRIKDGSGKILRQFLDTNRDGKLDQWSFYKNGIEIYRDIDSDFDNKTDQYRWLGTAGTKWGMDGNQDGKIDSWKMISGEEVAAEAFCAILDKDNARYLRILATSSELDSLKLGTRLTKISTDSIREAAAKFDEFAAAQKQISQKSEFVHFGSSRQGTIPQLTDGIEQDQIIYDHASAVFQTDKEFGQLALGTIIKLGDSWRVLELPAVIESGKAVSNGGLFFTNPEAVASVENPTTEKMSNLLEQFEQVEDKIATARGAELEKLELVRSNLFMQLIQAASSKEDRNNWVRLAADAVANSFQEDRFPTGLDKLEDIAEQLQAEKLDAQLDYIRWRVLSARFSKGIQGDTKERNTANERYLTDLENFVSDNSESEFAAEAMMQLALYAEVSEKGETDKALAWYTKVESQFPDSSSGKRAHGAKLRLSSAGKTLPFKGKTVNGKSFDLQSKDLRGKIVVLHFWASWCDACVKDFEELQRLGAKYRDDLVIVGVNIDDEQSAVKEVLAKHKSVAWTQLFEPGGMSDSPLAQQLGVATLPLTIIVDKEGKLVDADTTVGELDRDIQRVMRSVESTAKKN